MANGERVAPRNPRSVLVANRGEIAVRILRTAAELGAATVAVHSTDDETALHARRADRAVHLGRPGVSGYLDGQRIVEIAVDTGCEVVHPGYGFLAERADFARLCADAGLRFAGPDPDALDRLGDKVSARRLARDHGVPVVPGTDGPTTAEEAAAFVEQHGPSMVKAVAGGGGRGMRPVRDAAEVEDAHRRCRSEAEQAFGRGDVYVEKLVERARHVEVQVIGDGESVRHLWDRDCTLQRRHQKVVEVAPAPRLDPVVRQAMLDAAVRLATAVGYRSAGTFEFLVAGDDFWFMEANPRIQVEHTVTEEITGADIVRAQLLLAAGARLGDLSLPDGEPQGAAVQVRVNTETIAEDGTPRPTAGTITAFDVPTGPGIRVDTHGYTGYRTGTSFDPLLAKVVAHAPDLATAMTRAHRALSELRVDGVGTNVAFLQALLAHDDVIAGRWHTRFVDEHAAELQGSHRPLFPEPLDATRRAGARVDQSDPLAVLAYGKAQAPTAPGPAHGAGAPDDGTALVAAPVQGTVVSAAVAAGDEVRVGQELLVMEAMKMEHVVQAPVAGVVLRVDVVPGDTVHEGHTVVVIDPTDEADHLAEVSEEVDLDEIRPDLAEVLEMHARTLDENRPDAVARRRRTGQRTARENVDDLCDPGTFVEYGPLVISTPYERKPLGDLIERTATDGLVTGVGNVNGQLFGPERSRCMVLAYDYTVLAGTQGGMNHTKKDRMFELAEKMRLPVVLFSEGGGGRAGGGRAAQSAPAAPPPPSPSGERPFMGGASVLDAMAFYLYARLSGLVPLVAINSGRCFAGNAALLGCADVVIATESSSIGMGGPAMIEGGGLGVYHPDEVGPLSVQVPNGVVDIAVRDEAEAVAAAKRYLSYFQGPVAEWSCADQRLLRRAIPENRLRAYDVRKVIDLVCDTGSVLELRPQFGKAMVTALARVEGRPFGIIANNAAHLAGAIDSPAGDKASRFMQLCDAFGLPILFLCDTPGIMVGPEVEKTGVVRHANRMFVTGASLTVPVGTVVLRKAYGLGAMAMGGGGFKVAQYAVGWPTSEMGGMGLEGQVKLGYRDLLASIDDADERRSVYERLVARLYEVGRGLNTAVAFGLDDVIDPVDTRRWITQLLLSPVREQNPHKRRPNIDTW